MPSGHWSHELKKDNRRLKQENAAFRKELKAQERKLKLMGKKFKGGKKSGVSAKEMTEKLHQIKNMQESIKEYEGIIDRFSEENNMLREESLEAQRTVDEVNHRRKIMRKKMLKIIKILDKWLGKLSESEIERFRGSEDFELYRVFHDKHFKANEKEE